VFIVPPNHSGVTPRKACATLWSFGLQTSLAQALESSAERAQMPRVCQLQRPICAWVL
jgi:hypothetical protein